MKDYKKMIPNILTIIRIIFTPIIIILGILGQIHFVIILVILCALTDLLDGKLARKWNVVSEKGAKLDAVADKVFAIGLVASLIKNFQILIAVLILEIIIAITNLYYFKNLKAPKSLMIGKIKTTILFITIIFFFITSFQEQLIIVSNGLTCATINLQVLCLIFYLKHYIEEKNKKVITVENSDNHQNVIFDVELEQTKEINDLVELAEKYNLYEEKGID